MNQPPISLPGTKKLKTSLLLLFSFPVFWANIQHLRPFVYVLIFWCLWNFWQKTNNRLVYLGCLSFLAIIILSGIHNFFWQERHFLLAVADYSRSATFLPFRLRPWLFNPSALSVFVLGRTFSYFWLDQLFSLFGLGTTLIVVTCLIKRQILSVIGPLLAIFTACLVGSFALHPNPSGFYFLLLPVIMSLLPPLPRKYVLIVFMLNCLSFLI